MTEQTLFILKPDAVERNLIGEIISRFENNEFKLIKLKMFSFTKEMADQFYSEHKDKPFFNELVSFITSSPVVAAIVERENAIEKTREIIGATDPAKAMKDTIRKDFGIGITKNTIHASDSSQSFEKEVKVVFP